MGNKMAMDRGTFESAIPAPLDLMPAHLKFLSEDDMIKKQKQKLLNQMAQLNLPPKQIETLSTKDIDEQIKIVQDIESGFDPYLMNKVESFDGFTLYKRKQIATTLVRRYCYMLDQDFVENKVMLCAYSQGINCFQQHTQALQRDQTI